MNTEEQLLVLLGMTEQQQKTITAAVEELKKQTASLNGIAPELQKAVQVAIVASLARSMGDVSKEAQSAVKASVDPVIQSLSGVVAAANQAEAKLNRAVAAFGRRWLMLASVSAATVFFCASDGGPCRRLVGTLRAGEPESRKGGYARKHSPP
jgi:hypothetical protein